MRCCGTTLDPVPRPPSSLRTRRTRRVGEADRRGAGRGHHGDQAALARRPRASARRCDGGGVPAARLADLAADAARPTSPTCAPTAATRAAPATSRRERQLPARPARAGDAGATARAADGARPAGLGRADTDAARCSAPAPATTPLRRWALAPVPAIASSRWARPVWSARSVRPHRMTRKGSSPASPTPPVGSCRWCAPSTGRRCWRRWRRCCGVDFDELDRLALSAPAGAEGLTLVPYFEGERSPNLPDAAGALHGVTTRNLSPPTSPAPRWKACWLRWPTASTRSPDRASTSTHHPGWRRSALGGGPAHRPGDLGHAGARADAGRIRRAGCGQAGGMGAVAGRIRHRRGRSG